MDVHLPVQSVQELILSPEFLQELITNYLLEKLKISQDQKLPVSAMTERQRESTTWHVLRKGRLTASNFGYSLKAKRVTPSLIKRVLGVFKQSTGGKATSKKQSKSSLQYPNTKLSIDVQYTRTESDRLGYATVRLSGSPIARDLEKYTEVFTEGAKCWRIDSIGHVRTRPVSLCVGSTEQKSDRETLRKIH